MSDRPVPTAQVIVADASQRQALVAIRELGRTGTSCVAVETEPDVPAFASRWCVASATVPDFAREPDAFVDALLEVCARHQARVLIPCHDGTIEALRARRDDVDKAVSVALAPEAALAAAIEKRGTLTAAEALGVHVPRGTIVSDPGEIDAALDETGLPAVVKPERSWIGGRRFSVRVAPAREDAVAMIAELLEAGTSALVQEWLPGERLAVSFIYADGRFCARFAQRAERMYPPIGGSSVLRESIELPPDALAAAESLVADLDLVGYTEVEFRRDREGVPVLMEINPRLSASVQIAVRAGVPFPQLLYAWAAGEPLEAVDGYRIGARMRWLSGDISWLESALRERRHPDLPGRARAVRSFVADFAHPTGYDYWDPHDPGPALVAAADGARNARRRMTRRIRRGTQPAPPASATASSADTDVALIGAGPYALSLAAHLTAHGVAHEIFGEPMAGWLDHMPEGMSLKSEGCASSLSDPSGEHSLDRFCAEAGIEYGDVGIPVTLDTFTSYGKWFQERLVPDVRRTWVERVRPNPDGFELTLRSGDVLRARRVVLASGLEGCAHVPEPLAALPPEAVSHSYDHADLAPLAGRKVAVIGAGQSALETAALLHEKGSSVTLVARGPKLIWNGPPRLGPRRLRRRLRYPRSGLGDGKAVFFYAKAPLGFHAFPRAQRLKLVYSVLGPAGAWWLRERFEGHVDVRLNRSIVAADAADGQVRLKLHGADDSEELSAEHVVASTGYRPNIGRHEILEPSLRERIAQVEGAPSLSRSFESSVPGLYFVGFSTAVSFGPVMRFVYGADFTARHLSRHLAGAVSVSAP